MGKGQNSIFFVFIEGIAMKVTGGFSTDHGFYLTVTPDGTQICEHSVSIWEVTFSDEIEKEKLFHELFNLSSKAARSIDHKKGVPGLGAPVILLQELPAQEAIYEMAIDDIAVSV